MAETLGKMSISFEGRMPPQEEVGQVQQAVYSFFTGLGHRVQPMIEVVTVVFKPGDEIVFTVVLSVGNHGKEQVTLTQRDRTDYFLVGKPGALADYGRILYLADAADVHQLTSALAEATRVAVLLKSLELRRTMDELDSLKGGGLGIMAQPCRLEANTSLALLFQYL